MIDEYDLAGEAMQKAGYNMIVFGKNESLGLFVTMEQLTEIIVKLQKK